MERPALLILFAFAMTFSAASAAKPPDRSWTKVREGERVAVYTRDVPGSTFGPYRHRRALGALGPQSV